VTIDLTKISKDFPILSNKINGKDLVYFDNAATTQKPEVMIKKLVEYYLTTNANIHRGVHSLSQKATQEYEDVRDLIAKLYFAKRTEVIFTKSDTESLNLLAFSLNRGKNLQGKNIVITDTEHHSNIVPWQNNKNKAELRYVKFTRNGQIDLDDLETKIDSETEIFSFTWASNTFGIVNRAEEIIKKVRSKNPKTIIIIDAAQFAPHSKFNFEKLGVDFITFSAHKVFGPTGVGILIGKEELLEIMPPFLSGGDMIKEVDFEETKYNDLPYKFEAGTPNIADIIAFGESLRYLENLGWENIKSYENELAKYLLASLNKLDFVEIYGPKEFEENKLPLVAFNVKGVHPHDIGTILDENGIAVRTGHHCTQLIMKRLAIPASVRASLAFYNTKEEIDYFIECLKKVRKIFE